MPIKVQPVLMIIVVFLVLNSRFAAAAVIDDLFDARIPVVNQSQKVQEQGFALALKQVLVKVRGNTDILDNPQIKQTINRATRLVQAYQYDVVEEQLFLVVNFDPRRVETIIRNQGFPVWDKRRPDSLIWLAIENEQSGTREIVTAHKHADIHQQLNDKSELRGLKLIFPLWDLDDHQALNIYDIWGGFIAQIKQASERYSVRSVLSARIYQDSPLNSDNNSVGRVRLQSNTQWLADWTMIESGTLLSGQIKGNNPLLVSAGLVDLLADQLSAKYAIDLGQLDANKRKVSIIINNINSLVYYAQALALLENLSVVNSATLIGQQGEKATFELDLLGDVDDLTNALSLDINIQPVVDDFGQPLGNLEFFWVK